MMAYELGGVELVIEWRCWREDGSYGPPCTNPVDRVEHKWDHRHWDCCWIGYVELGQDQEPRSELMDKPPDEEITKLKGTIPPPKPPMMRIELAMDEDSAKTLADILMAQPSSAWHEVAESLRVVASGKYDSSGDYEVNSYEVSTP